MHSCTGKRYKTASVHDIKTYAGGAYSFLNSAPDTGEWSPTRQGRSTPQGKTPRAHWIRGWVSPRAGLGDLEKRKTSEPCRKLSSDRRASRLVTIPTTPCRIGFQVTQIEAQINRKLVYFEPIRAETRLRYPASPRGTCDGQSAIEISLSPNYFNFALSASFHPCPILPMLRYLTNWHCGQIKHLYLIYSQACFQVYCGWTALNTSTCVRSGALGISLSLALSHSHIQTHTWFT